MLQREQLARKRVRELPLLFPGVEETLAAMAKPERPRDATHAINRLTTQVTFPSAFWGETLSACFEIIEYVLKSGRRNGRHRLRGSWRSETSQVRAIMHRCTTFQRTFDDLFLKRPCASMTAHLASARARTSCIQCLPNECSAATPIC